MKDLEYETFSCLEDIEFSILDKVDTYEDVSIEEIRDCSFGLDNFIEGHFTFGVIVGFVGEYAIIKHRQDRLVLLKNRGYSLGERYIWSYKNQDKKVIKINKDVNSEFILEMKKYEICRWDGISSEYLEKIDELTKEMIKGEIIPKVKKREIEDKQEEERRDRENEEKERRDRENEKEWNTGNGSGKYENCNIKGKEITFDVEDIKFKLKKRVNLLFNRSYFTYGLVYSDRLTEKLLREKIPFEKYIGGIKQCNVSFDEEKIFFNGVRMLKNKAEKIFFKIDENTTKEQIELMKKLTGQKEKILELKEIRFKETSIPINFSIIDKYNFVIEFLEEKKETSWEDLKEIFFGNSLCVSRCFGTTQFKELYTFMGITKEKIFEKLRKLKMIQELENGD